MVDILIVGDDNSTRRLLERILNRVDLPSPFAPMIPTLSPSLIDRVTSFNISSIP